MNRTLVCCANQQPAAVGRSMEKRCENDQNNNTNQEALRPGAHPTDTDARRRRRFFWRHCNITECAVDRICTSSGASCVSQPMKKRWKKLWKRLAKLIFDEEYKFSTFLSPAGGLVVRVIAGICTCCTSSLAIRSGCPGRYTYIFVYPILVNGPHGWHMRVK